MHKNQQTAHCCSTGHRLAINHLWRAVNIPSYESRISRVKAKYDCGPSHEYLYVPNGSENIKEPYSLFSIKLSGKHALNFVICYHSITTVSQVTKNDRLRCIGHVKRDLVADCVTMKVDQILFRCATLPKSTSMVQYTNPKHNHTHIPNSQNSGPSE